MLIFSQKFFNKLEKDIINVEKYLQNNYVTV